jgi:heterotetrameric sarcosine oxidase gamma subunit
MAERDGWLAPMAYASVEEEIRSAREGTVLCDIGGGARILVRGAIEGGAGLGIELPYRLAHHSSEVQKNGVRAWIRLARLADDELLILSEYAQRRMIGGWARTAWPNETVIDLTSAYTAFHLIGPQSRDVLTRLVRVNLRGSELGQGTLLQCSFAGVSALVMRWDWGGAEGFEILVSSDYGQFVWSTLLDAGAEMSIRPMGMAAYWSESPARG